MPRGVRSALTLDDRPADFSDSEALSRAWLPESIIRQARWTATDCEEVTPIPTTTERGNSNHIAHDLCEDVPGRTCPDFDALTFTYDNARYTQYIGQAFGFFRRHSEGRYSDATLMRLARAVDLANYGGESDKSALPYLVVAQVPTSYDELTEVKTGGIVGMAALWPNMENRLILCTARRARRAGYAKALLRIVQWNWGGSIHTWVGQGNLAGQSFLAGQGLYPTVIAPSGAIRYGTSALDADEEQGFRDDDQPVMAYALRD